MSQTQKSNQSLLQKSIAYYLEYQDNLVKIAVIAGLLGFVGYRILIFSQFPGTWESTLRHFHYQALLSNQNVEPLGSVQWFWGVRLALWIIESLNLAAYVISYWTRIPPLKRAEGMMETLFPFAVSGIPFIIVLFRTKLFISVTTSSIHFYLYLFILGLMSLGSVITCLGVLHLKRSFSIRVEVRALVQSGPYRWVRHPIYLGYFITFLGSCILHFNELTVVLYFVFLAGQIGRSRLEEEKMRGAIPEYAVYQAQTGMFLPKIK
ncbi:isoprenylcysteine carboxylmethyltransferase family protein [candidate division KSB1 bacterium]|nr:isoprenylcysteine carboxylmethyltransferase family protein [candidate division KSB1 bacterium]